MTTPVTLKVRPKVFAKLEAMKRMYIAMYQRDVTWDDFLEELVSKFLPFYVLEMYVKVRGSFPKTMEEFSKGLSYIEGLLDGYGISAEHVVDALEKIAESLPKSNPSKSSMYS